MVSGSFFAGERNLFVVVKDFDYDMGLYILGGQRAQLAFFFSLTLNFDGIISSFFQLNLLN